MTTSATNMAQLLDGKILAETIRTKMAARVSALSETPLLGVILVGDDPASHTYVGLKQKACEEAGIGFELTHYDAGVSEETLLEKVEELNEREDATGILVQLPLPSQSADRIIAAIDPKKDVDGFHPENVSALLAGKPAIAPATALGVMKLLDATKEPLEGKRASVIASPLFAEPLLHLLQERSIEALREDAPSAATKSADIVIIALGKPAILSSTHVQEGAIVIDVGTTKLEGKLVGDADPSIDAIASHRTPVPGGVGPMTVAMLIVNILKAHQLQGKK